MSIFDISALTGIGRSGEILFYLWIKKRETETESMDPLYLLRSLFVA
jgi:hypothetical protein